MISFVRQGGKGVRGDMNADMYDEQSVEGIVRTGDRIRMSTKEEGRSTLNISTSY